MTRPHVPTSLDRRVRLRAGHRCEYCRLAQLRQEATFHIDHVTPVRDSGPTTFENLALACVSCSLRKGARRHGDDPTSAEAARLFDPRADAWHEHFDVLGDASIVGRTPIGRATASLLALNRPLAVAIRAAEMAASRYP